MSAAKEWYLLRNAVYQKDFAEAQRLINAHSNLLTATNGIGETVLHFLAVENDEDGVAWLQARGFDINTKNKFRVPVVFEVAQLGYQNLLKWFMETGADLTATDAAGRDLRSYLTEFDRADMIAFLDAPST